MTMKDDLMNAVLYDPSFVESMHSQGKLTARERISLLFDNSKFTELGLLVQHQCHDFDMDKKRPFGDGVITAFGTVNDRLVYAYAQDCSVFGGSVGQASSAKICYLIELAIKVRAPVVALVDSAGARIQEGVASYSRIFYENVRASGYIPQVTAIMGNCAGGGVYSPALTDVVLMVGNSSWMFLTGPLVIKKTIDEEISKDELGGSRVHSEVSGNCDIVSSSDAECISDIKKVLSYLPSSCLELPSRIKTVPNPFNPNELAEILPGPQQAFDVKDILQRITDGGDFLEIKKGFAKNMVTGFARIGGLAVGIVANQPKVMAGAIDINASDKAGRFYRLCDCYNIPIITFVDVPGYLPGVDQERKGIIRHGAKMLFGYAEATVPKITCIIRKAYGGSYASMGSRDLSADIVLAWPTAEMAVIGAEGAVEIVYQKELREAVEREKVLEKRIAEYREKFYTPLFSASTRRVDIVIQPQDTRDTIINLLEGLVTKSEQPLPKKHGNIPL